MSQITYAPFVDRMVSKYEGGYGWNKKDTGGPTKYGITCYDLAAHMGQKMDSMTRWAPIVRAMTLQTAEAIYQTKYATAIRYNDLPRGVDTCMFDYGVNSGTSRPINVARAICKLPAKGGMDAALLAAIRKADPIVFINAMCAERLQFMHAIRGGSAWKEFGGGWSARVADLKAYSDHLAVGADLASAPHAVDLSGVAQPKAINVASTATTPTLSGAAASGLAAHTAGLSWLITGGVVIAAVAAGVAYEAVSARAASKANTNVVLPNVPLPELAAA